MEKTQSTRLSSEKLIASMRKKGHFLSNLIMPSLSVFISWGFLSILNQYLEGPLHEALLEVDAAMLRFLLPILIGFTGGRLMEKSRGGVVGAVATIGVIIGSTIPEFVGAMIMGPLAGWLIKKCDEILLPKVKIGYEMLFRNLSAGLIGSLLCCLGILVLGPVLEAASIFNNQVLAWLIERNFLPLVNVLLEPLKVFFFNNTINHGIFTPLGIDGVQQTGSSILFLIEVNPGPGFGVLLATFFFNRQVSKANTSSAMMIHGIGGIHEIYFPFVLMNPLLFLAVIVGGVTGTAIFQMTNVGLSAPVSPGSIVTILANTPLRFLPGVAGGIIVSAAVSFLLAAIIIYHDQPKEISKEMEQPMGEIKKIVFACDSGLGSSAMGASLLRRKLNEKNINIPVSYQSVFRLEDDPAMLVIVQKELAESAAKNAPLARKVLITNFVESAEYEALVDTLVNQSVASTKNSEAPQEALPYEKVIFLYADDVRGSQTMAVQVLKLALQKVEMTAIVEKQPLETTELNDRSLYIISEAFQQDYPVTDVPLLVVPNIVTANYEKLLKGGLADVTIIKGNPTAK